MNLLTAVKKYPTRRNLQEEGFTAAQFVRAQPTVVGKAGLSQWLQELTAQTPPIWADQDAEKRGYNTSQLAFLFPPF